MNHAQLFKEARDALGLTVRDMQRELCIADERTVRRIESGEITVYGPTWVAIYYILMEFSDRASTDDRAVEMTTLADRIMSYAESMHDVPASQS